MLKYVKAWIYTTALSRTYYTIYDIALSIVQHATNHQIDKLCCLFNDRNPWKIRLPNIVWQLQTNIWANVGLYSQMFCSFHLTAVPQELFMSSIRSFVQKVHNSITYHISWGKLINCNGKITRVKERVKNMGACITWNHSGSWYEHTAKTQNNTVDLKVIYSTRRKIHHGYIEWMNLYRRMLSPLASHLC